MILPIGNRLQVNIFINIYILLDHKYNTKIYKEEYSIFKLML